MNSKYSNHFIDFGNDLNKDKHCDVDGWFVNNTGNHKPILRPIGNNQRNIAIAGPKFNGINIQKQFDVSGTVDGIKLSSLYEYSLNNDNVELSSPNINHALRNRDFNNPNVLKRIMDLDNLINHFVLKEPMTVYRGISCSVHDFFNMKIPTEVGSIYVDPAYLSTTHAMKVAVEYASKKEIMVLFKINLPKGMHCIPLYEENKTAGSGNESEILLPRNTELSVTFMNATNNDHFIIFYYSMEVIS